MERRTPWLGYLCVILSAVIFGCMPLGANFLYAQGVTPMSLVFLRNLLSLPVLALLCQKQGGLRISRGALLETSLTGFFGCCITPILLFSSYRYLASGMATVFHFAYPVIVVLGGLVLRERVQKKALFCAVLCSLGILLLIDPSGAVDPLGVALALTSGVTYAVYILLLAHFRHREVMGFRMTFYMALISAVCMFFLCLFSHQLCLPQTLAGWLAALAFSLMICIGAVMLFQKGTFLIGAQRAAILSTFEPITSIFVGILFLNETLTPRILLGSAITLRKDGGEQRDLFIALSLRHGRRGGADGGGQRVLTGHRITSGQFMHRAQK